MSNFWRRAGTIAFVAFCALIIPNLAKAADPIRVGFSMALTGGVAPAGKQVLAALQIWRDDVNAKGGLLGRPVELVFYDDQSNPQNVPALYTKLIEVDKVDLLIGPLCDQHGGAGYPGLDAVPQDYHRHSRQCRQQQIPLRSILLDATNRTRAAEGIFLRLL
jgi:hypothetical protein